MPDEEARPARPGGLNWRQGPPILANQDTSDSGVRQIGTMPLAPTAPRYQASVPRPRSLGKPGLGGPPFLASQGYEDDSGVRQPRGEVPDFSQTGTNVPPARPLPWRQGPPLLSWQQDPSTRQQIGTDPLPVTDPHFDALVPPEKLSISGMAPGPPILAHQQDEHQQDTNPPAQIGTTGDLFQSYEQPSLPRFGQGRFAQGPPILRSQEGSVFIPHRITQEAVEIVLLPTDAFARITQAGVEAVILPGDAKARVTQVGVEVVMNVSNVMRVTQLGVEVVMQRTLEDSEVSIID